LYNVLSYVVSLTQKSGKYKSVQKDTLYVQDFSMI
jgi:hypothetical protein